MSVDFNLPEGTKSYNLYKLHPPFKKLVDGYGYPGVILERESDGKLQCHICGEWFESLPRHILYNHDMTSKSYKVKFGMRKKDALVCKKIKKQRSAIGKKFAVNLRPGKAKQKIKGVVTKRNQEWEHKNSMAALNEVGLCPDQVDHRFDIVASQIGKQPTSKDLQNNDAKILSHIRLKFGTFNKYLDYRGMQHNPASGGGGNTIPSINMLAAIRNIYLEKGRVSKASFNGKPSYETIRRHFGSLENACREAGIDPSNWTMVG